MKNNRLAALLIALVLLIQMLPGMAFAVNADSPVTISVGNAEGKTGDTVKLTVSISHNTGFAGFTLKASYDKRALTLTKIEQGAVLNTMDTSGLISNVSVGVANWASTTNTTGNGILMTMTFTVNEGASSGDYSVALTAEDFFSVDDSGRFLDCPTQMTAGTVTVAKPVNPFADVAAGSFYYEPVLWAVENGITTGTSATTFGPNDQCMRAHVVTFLWRAVGCPEPTRTDNPFVDVKPADFFYKPVLWALENGITSGLDATHFGPTSYCNRAQVVTFLYRTKKTPAVNASNNPFEDVKPADFFYKPVLWALENGVTSGIDATHFGPAANCNRAQIVTFLYRAFVD